MARRGGAPWIVVEHDRFVVRYIQEGDDLLERPAKALVHPYYLTSVKSFGGQVLGRDVVVDDLEAWRVTAPETSCAANLPSRPATR